MPKKFSEINVDNIERVFVVNTGHITEDDGKLIQEPMDKSPVRILPFEYGAHITIIPELDVTAFLENDAPKLLEHGFSSSFVSVLAKAVANDISFVILDAHGNFDDELPTFDW
jgi:hypothetical protein